MRVVRDNPESTSSPLIKLTRSCTNAIGLVCAIIFLRQLHPSFVCVSWLAGWLAIAASDPLFLCLRNCRPRYATARCTVLLYAQPRKLVQRIQRTEHNTSLLNASPFTHAPDMQFMLGHVMLQPCAGLCGHDSSVFNDGIKAGCMWWKRGSCVHHETLKFSSCMHMIVRP